MNTKLPHSCKASDLKRVLCLRGRPALTLLLIAVGPLSPAAAEPQEKASKTDPWGPLSWLEGTWEGAIDGQFGQGTAIRRYEYVLEGLYLLERHASVRLPQEDSPEGDHHREITIFSVDRETGTVALREFHVEGFVITYKCEVQPQRVVCISDAVESGKGMRARLTLSIPNPHQFDERFELASPGEPLELYFRNRWTRVPDLADATR